MNTNDLQIPNAPASDSSGSRVEQLTGGVLRVSFPAAVNPHPELAVHHATRVDEGPLRMNLETGEMQQLGITRNTPSVPRHTANPFESARNAGGLQSAARTLSSDTLLDMAGTTVNIATAMNLGWVRNTGPGTYELTAAYNQFVANGGR